MSKTKWHSKVIHLVVALLVVALVLVLSSSPVPTLAAPVVTSVTETAFGSDTTDHYVSMPATVDAGNLLIVLFTNDGGDTVTTPAGWNELASNSIPNQVRFSVYYKIAAGTEGGTTVNFVTAGNEQAAAEVYRITSWHGTTPPEISTIATGTDTAPNPASLNPAGWDVADTLWLAVAGQDRGSVGTPAYPASYTDGISTLSSGDNGSCRTLSARRVLAAASENPGAFTIVSEQWVAFTIAVRPAQRDLTISSTVGGSVTEPGEDTFTYDEGTIVDLVATPNAGYRFDEWTGDVGTIYDVYDASTTITMNGDYSITANFVRQYDLHTDSTEGGSITEPGENTFTYDEGTVVDLIAEADACYELINWTGDVDTIADVYAASTNITMDAAKNVTANFALLSYNLTADSTDGGSVTDPGEGTFTYDCGMVVNLVATPDEGYRFDEWTGDVGTIADVYAAATNITVNNDYSITANFVVIYDLTISSTEGGSVTTPGEGVFTYDEGTVVDLVAEADTCYELINWTGDVDTIADVYAASTNITMDAAKNVTANFALLSYNLTADSTTGGSVTDPGEDTFTYDCGTVVDLVAEADACYEFVNWTGGVGTIADVYAASTNITMNGDYSINANFAMLSYNLTADSTTGGSVTDPGEDTFTYDCGTVVDLVAEAEEGYRFDEWTGDVGTIADVNATATNITMNGDYSITAEFVRQYDLTTNSTGGGSVTTPGEGVFTYDEGTVVDLVAEADACYEFVNWTGNVSTIADVNAAATNITLNGDYSITANFAMLSYNLTADSTTGGSVTDPGEDTFTYDCGTVVDLVAEAVACYEFVNWTGDVGTIADVYAASTNITMNGDYSIIANFVAIYDLTMAADPEVGGTATDLTNESPYAEGTEVSIKAEANEGYEFVNWTAPAGGFDDASAAETIFTMPAQNVTVIANFEEIPPSLEDPTVTTQAATSITTNSTTLNMIYTVGDFNPVEVRFAYKKSTGSAWSSTDWVSKSGNGTYAKSLTGLSSNTEYEFKARLKYNDTVIEGTTLQFTTDTSPTLPPPEGCFIATAAYGTPTAEQLDVLREFRDVVLLKSTVGSQFVALYYQLSPPVADFIAGSSFLRTIVRELLVDPIVWVVEATGDMWRN